MKRCKKKNMKFNYLQSCRVILGGNKYQNGYFREKATKFHNGFINISKILLIKFSKPLLTFPHKCKFKS